MAEYTKSELLNQITDRIYENHERAISGMDLQEMLIDIVDSLSKYTDDAVVEPAINYYADEIQIDGEAKTITLVRAGGITPINISASMLGMTDHRKAEVVLTSGDNNIIFDTGFPLGTSYIILKSVIATSGGFDIGGIVSAKTELGFAINVSEASTIIYLAIR